MHYQASLEDADSRRISTRTFKIGVALIGGACLMLLATPAVFPGLLQSATEATNLASMPTTLQKSATFGRQGSLLASLPSGGGPWKELAIATLEATQNCGRDVAAKARARSMFMNLDSQSKAELARIAVKVDAKKKAVEAEFSELPGVVSPVQYFDPLKLSAAANEGQVLFFREAELKHGRVCMLASLGFVTGERFHPLFGGDIDAPSFSSELFSAPAIGPFWLALLVATGGIELFSSAGRWQGTQSQGITQELVPGVVPGDLGFDPLNIKPKDPELWLKRQNQELLNGRLAMIASIGMLAEEIFLNGEKLHFFLFDPAFSTR
jgi:hypothetical protein